MATAALKRKVSAAAGGGMSHEEIALGLGISRKTLEKHFEVELSAGAYARRIEALEGLQRNAKKGNAAAAKAYLQAQPQLAVPPAASQQTGQGKQPETGAPAAAPAPAPAEKLGKKEQAAVDARTAGEGNEWGDVLPRFSSNGQVH